MPKSAITRTSIPSKVPGGTLFDLISIKCYKYAGSFRTNVPDYKVTKQRGNRPEEIVCAFDADNDEVARVIFESYKNNKNYSWDNLKLVRCTEEIVIEISEASSRQKHDHSRGLCGKPDTSSNSIKMEDAIENPPKCLCCGSKMSVYKCSSTGMQQLGMFWLICPICPASSKHAGA